MKLQTTLSALALAAVGFAAVPAQAATPCAITDISPNAEACAGFFDGNLLSGSPTDIAAQTAALGTLGFSWDGDWNAVDKISGLGGSHTVDFATLLQGVSYVAFHFGNGQGGPGNATAFYRLDAGAGLDTITLNYNASSNAVLYSTTPVPEPETYALMLAGLVGVGFMARRRKIT